MTHTPDSARAAGLVVEAGHDCFDCDATNTDCVLAERGGWLESICLDCWGDKKYEDADGAEVAA